MLGKLIFGNPWVFGAIALVIVALSGYGFMERNNRIAAEKGEKAAQELADLAQQDAKRWHAASDLRDSSITDLKSMVEQQNTALDAQKQEAQEANRRTGELAAEAQRTKEADDRKIQELEDDAQKHPENDRPLGPIGLQYGKLMYAR